MKTQRNRKRRNTRKRGGFIKKLQDAYFCRQQQKKIDSGVYNGNDVAIYKERCKNAWFHPTYEANIAKLGTELSGPRDYTFRTNNQINSTLNETRKRNLRNRNDINYFTNRQFQKIKEKENERQKIISARRQAHKESIDPTFYLDVDPKKIQEDSELARLNYIEQAEPARLKYMESIDSYQLNESNRNLKYYNLEQLKDLQKEYFDKMKLAVLTPAQVQVFEKQMEAIDARIKEEENTESV